MKKIFEIPELEVVRFVEADIVVCSDCHKEWECGCYKSSDGTINCTPYDSDEHLEDCEADRCIIDNDYTDDPYHSHYTAE